MANCCAQKAIALLLIAFGLWLIRPADAAAQTRYSPPTSGFVSIEGTHLLRDGVPWVPKGVILNAQNAPRTHVFARSSAQYASNMATLEHWGISEIEAIRAFGADTIRFNASEAALDPENPIHNTDYLTFLVNSIRLARSEGMTVEVAMQWEKPGGDPSLRGIPGENTVRAWRTLLPYVGHDTGIILEAFNEPAMASNGKSLPQWWFGWARRFQMLVTEMRQAGAQNLILLDGLIGGELLSGQSYDARHIQDPLRRLGYAVHAFPISKAHGDAINAITPADWEANWGAFCKHAVCIVTAFFTGTSLFCYPEGNPSFPGSPEIAASLLAYLKQRHIGIFGFSFDYTRFLTRSYATHEPTNFRGFYTCNKSKRYHGVGWMLSHYFKTGQVVNDRTGELVTAP